MIGTYVLYGVFGLSVLGCWLIVFYGMTVWEEGNCYSILWLQYKVYPDGTYRPQLETYHVEVFIGVAGFSFFPVINTLIVLGFLLWLADNATRRMER